MTQTQPERFLVVGVDGSEGGQRALRWALAEAAARDANVRVVSAWAFEGPEPEGPQTAQEARSVAERAVIQTVTAVCGAAPPDRISTEVSEGSPAIVLSRAADGAAFLVLGSHGYGIIESRIVGSVCVESIRHATCPVVILPPAFSVA